MEERLIELEVRYMHQAKLVDDLSDIVRTQQQQIDQITLAFKRLQDRVESADIGQNVPHERPPHY